MEKLGIEPVLLAAQIVNFLVILVVLQKLLYKPILGMLEKRKREITKQKNWLREQITLNWGLI